MGFYIDKTHGLKLAGRYGGVETHRDRGVLGCGMNAITKGRLSFHPIPCGTALFGHVTSGAIYTAHSQVRRVTGSPPLLPTSVSHWNLGQVLKQQTALIVFCVCLYFWMSILATS